MFKLLFSPEYWVAGKHQKAVIRIREDKKMSEVEKAKAMVDLDRRMTWAEKMLAIAKINLDAKIITELEFHKQVATHDTSEVNKKISEAHIKQLEGMTTKYQMQVELAEVLMGPGLTFENHKNKLALDHNEIDEHQFNKRKIELEAGLSTVDKELKKLEYDYENGLISEIDAKKEVATINKEPFISVSSVYDPAKGVQGLSFSFEWNDFWVKTLHDTGYRGTDEEMMNHWFMDICRSAILEESLSSPESSATQKIIKRVVDDQVSYIS